jgi:hypothetical protein
MNLQFLSLISTQNEINQPLAQKQNYQAVRKEEDKK